MGLVGDHPEVLAVATSAGAALYVAVSAALPSSRPEAAARRWTLYVGCAGLLGIAGRLAELLSPGPSPAACAAQVAAVSCAVTVTAIHGEAALDPSEPTRARWLLNRLPVVTGAVAAGLLLVQGSAATPQAGTADAIVRTVALAAPLIAANLKLAALLAQPSDAPPSARRAIAVAAGAVVLAALFDLGGRGTGAWSAGALPFGLLLSMIALDQRRREAEPAPAGASETATEPSDHEDGAPPADAAESREVRLRFVANVSHELRTPVHGILGLASLLADTKLDSQQTELLNHLSVSGRALRLLIDDILDYARIEAGKIEIRPDWEDPRKVVGDVLATVAHAAFQKGLGLEARFSANVPVHVHTDAQRLRQILLNLVGNAVKFTQVGQVTVRVRLRRVDDTNGVLDCTVSDSGIGMPRDRLPHLFDPFVQGNAADNRTLGGSGLGLAISRDLARALGGELTADSELGRGSQFRVAVPVGLRPEPNLWRLPLPPGTKVLVLDWDGLLRFAIEPMLQSCHAEVTWRRSVAEVRPEESFDVIIDAPLALPVDVDALRRRCGARWIVCPALNDQVVRPRGIKPDATVFRPVVPDRLADVLRDPITNREPANAAAAPEPLDVLVVDDNAVNLLVACRIVEAMGHRTYAANDGLEALQKLDEIRVDLILMDCQMPGLDGYETTRRIRARYGRTHRILALTAAAFEQDRYRALEAGMDGLLHKPVDMDRLREALHRPPSRPETPMVDPDNAPTMT